MNSPLAEEQGYPSRPLPRPFSMAGGSGHIVEEVSAARPHWEPTIQLVRFDDGSESLRVCYYHCPRFGRGPMILDDEALDQRGLVLVDAPRIHAMLRRLVGVE
jgi:hypothetical protein